MLAAITDKGHEHLRQLSFTKAKELYGEQLPNNVSNRINFELQIIEEREVSDFFLFLHEVVTVAQAHLGVWVGPGRGTAASSLINYCLGITKVDPLKYDLLFEQFIRPLDALTPYVALDIDLEGKESVMDWLRQKYGDPCDFLNGEFELYGLEALSIMRDAIEVIKASKGVSIDVEKIPIDDTKTFELFQKGRTEEIFQFETKEMRELLIEFHPTCLEELAALNSLFQAHRTADIRMLIKRKNKKQPIRYPLPEVGKILDKTYGVIVYQEQIMRIARLISNFTSDESDLLRRVVCKKRIALIPTLKAQFMEGGLENGHPRHNLKKTWDAIERNAVFAFMKAHAVCYTWIAYQMAYLKANYPEEFKEVIEKYSLE